jgi:hypothetical protein
MPFESTLAELDMRRLQVAFSDLFDRAAEAIQRLALDQDDIVLDRILVCRTPAGLRETPAEWLADKDRLIAGLQAHLGTPTETKRDSAPPSIAGLKVVVRSSPLPLREFPIS